MLNIVTVSTGWVCSWIAHQLAARLGCSVNPYAIEGTNIYVPYYLLQTKSLRDIALFTHHDNFEHWDRAAKLADVCWAMSHNTARHLPPEKTVVMPIPPDPQFHRRIVFGVSGREYAETPRKRTHWIERLQQIPGIEIRFTNGTIAWEGMPAWYRSIDYLLVLADNEGGPMGVVEAVASGRPVIAPDVGWAWDYPVIRYETWEDLERIVRRLVMRPDGWPILTSKIRALC